MDNKEKQPEQNNRGAFGFLTDDEMVETLEALQEAYEDGYLLD